MPVYIQIAVPQRVLDSVRPKGEPSTVAGCVQLSDGVWAVKTLIEPFPSESPPKSAARLPHTSLRSSSRLTPTSARRVIRLGCGWSTAKTKSRRSAVRPVAVRTCLH